MARSAAAAASAAANASLLANTNLFTLSAHHQPFLAAEAVCDYDFHHYPHQGGALSQLISSRYGHRREVEVGSSAASTPLVNPFVVISSTNSLHAAVAAADDAAEGTRSSARQAAEASAPKGKASRGGGSAKTPASAGVEEMSSAAAAAPPLTARCHSASSTADLPSAASVAGMGFIAKLLRAVDGSDEEVLIACRPRNPLSDFTLASEQPSSSSSATAVSALNKCPNAATIPPLLRQIDAFETLCNDEVSNIRAFYGFGPVGARKRPRIVSDADRLNTMNAVTNPFVISKRALVAEFSMSGAPTVCEAGGGDGITSSAGASSSGPGVASPQSMTANKEFPSAQAMYGRGSGGALGAAHSSTVLPSVTSSAVFKAPPSTPAAVVAGAVASASATASAPMHAVACEVAKTIPVTCPDTVSAVAVQKLALDLVHYSAQCAVARRQPFAGRSYVVGVEEGLSSVIVPTAGAPSDSVVAATNVASVGLALNGTGGNSVSAGGSSATSEGANGMSGRARKRGGAV